MSAANTPVVNCPACPSCNCPSCPKCPDCAAGGTTSAPSTSAGTGVLVIPEETNKYMKLSLSNPLVWIAIAVALYFFFFHTEMGSGLFTKFAPASLQSLVAPSAPPYAMYAPH